MVEYVWLIPLLPLASAVLLIFSTGRLPRALIPVFGVGSVGLAAVCVLLTALSWRGNPVPQQLFLWSWMQVGDFSADVGFYIDGLTLVMMSVITGVGFLIHLYSAEFMESDASYSRYFAYLNLFVAAMLILVMADNLLLLYLGWEGVGTCSYLLVGFWYQDPANGAAARKAFIVTRVGDTAMALGLYVLFTELGTLNIQEMVVRAQALWQVGDPTVVLATALLLAGAAGKSAQLPLHTWLPDAMAGPTPVSALIHAATMVTAGVYLIARTHELFILAPPTQFAVAIMGLLTLLLAACSALNQHDIKRILAYSTISQIGYMFLALGVGAWSAGIFHLMTHAFFKALLFLGAGAVLYSLRGEHDISRMGGLRSRLPIVFWSFLIGSAALSALPFTSGFFSKDEIVAAAFNYPGVGPWLWAGAILGALLTGLYSFRLVFLVFFGEAKTEPDRSPGWRMFWPLAILCCFALVGGWIVQPLGQVFPAAAAEHPPGAIIWIDIAIPIAGVLLAYFIFLGRQLSVTTLMNSPLGRSLHQFWYQGWRIDELYDRVWVRPYRSIARALHNEPVDQLYNVVVRICSGLNSLLSASQNGRMRWYIIAMVVGVVVLLAMITQGLKPGVQ